MKRLTPILVLLLAALWPLSGGSYPTHGNPGGKLIHDGMGTEETLKVLYDLKRLKAPTRTGGFTTIYVSSQAGGDYPIGVDTNIGSADLPIKTLDRVQEIITERGCGLEFVFDGGDVWTGSDLGSGADAITTTCTTYPDEIAIYLRSSDPDSRATFDCTGSTVSAAALFGADAATDGGWVVIEGFYAQNCVTDNFDTTNAAKMLLVNSGADRVSGNGNQIFTSHGTSTILALNVFGSVDNAGATSANIATPVLTSDITIISDNKFYADSGATGAGLFTTGSDGGTLWLIGVEATKTAATTGEIRGIGTDPGVGVTSTVVVARALFHDLGTGGTTAAMYLKGNNAGAISAVSVYETTFATMEYGIVAQPTDADGFVNLYGRCIILDEIDKEMFSNSTYSADMLVDIQYSIYDDDDAVNGWRVDGSGVGGAVADLAAAYAIVGPVGDNTSPNFFTNSTEGTGIQWDSSGVGTQANVTPMNGCNPNMECWGACDVEYTLTFPTAIPDFVLDTEIQYITLGGTDGNAGGR